MCPMKYKTNNLIIDLRAASINDISDIYNIESEAFGLSHWSKETFIAELTSAHSNYLVSVLLEPSNSTYAGKVIGYAGYWKIIQEGHITTMAVHCQYRGLGIADILLYNLIKNAQLNSINWLTLEVRTSNKIAINIYKKFMFKTIGIRKNYYQSNNEDALILWTENINSIEYNKILEVIIKPYLLKDIYADKCNYY